MRTTVTINDELYEQALALADPDMDTSDLFREALKTLSGFMRAGLQGLNRHPSFPHEHQARWLCRPVLTDYLLMTWFPAASQLLPLTPRIENLMSYQEAITSAIARSASAHTRNEPESSLEKGSVSRTRTDSS